MTSIRITSNLEKIGGAHGAGVTRTEASRIVDWRTDDPQWLGANNTGDPGTQASLLMPTIVGLIATAIAVAMVIVTFL